MKRIFTFSACTTLLLGFAGLVAANIAKRSINVPSYYVTATLHSKCVFCETGSYTCHGSGSQKLCKSMTGLFLYTRGPSSGIGAASTCGCPAYLRVAN